MARKPKPVAPPAAVLPGKPVDAAAPSIADLMARHKGDLRAVEAEVREALAGADKRRHDAIGALKAADRALAQAQADRVATEAVLETIEAIAAYQRASR